MDERRMILGTAPWPLRGRRKEARMMDTLTLTWINTLFLIVGMVTVLVNLVSLHRQSVRHDVALHAIADALKTLAEIRR